MIQENKWTGVDLLGTSHIFADLKGIKKDQLLVILFFVVCLLVHLINCSIFKTKIVIAPNAKVCIHGKFYHLALGINNTTVTLGGDTQAKILSLVITFITTIIDL